MIIKDIRDVKEITRAHLQNQRRLFVTSGGFDPLHAGHVRCIRHAAQLASYEYGFLLVIVNGDGFLERKKGFKFMSLDERMEIIDSIKGVDYVTSWDDGSQYVTGALHILQPHAFMKGGDRSSPEAVPEYKLCQEIGCQVFFGVGGTEKIQSSSDLISKVKEC